MNRSRLLALFCGVALIGLTSGCSDDDDDVVTPPGPQPVTPEFVAGGLAVVIPAAIEFPVGLIEILGAFNPPATAPLGGPVCTPLPLNICSTSGEAEYCTTEDSFTQDWVFTNCVDEDGTTINGTVSATTNGTTVTFTFPSSGFTIGGNPITGQLSIDSLSAVGFSNLDVTAEGTSVTATTGSLTIISDVVNGTLQLTVQSSVYAAFQAAVTIASNSITAVATPTDPPTTYNCSGALSVSDGDISASVNCLEAEKGDIPL